jgi:hypothetical protein
MKEQQIIGIKISIGKRLGSIIIRDSYLLLPSSLAKLAKAYNIDSSLHKGVEPVLTSSRSGRFFVQNNISHYNKEVAQFNSFPQWKEAVMEYCSMDCISLYHVLANFKDLIYEHFSVNMEAYPTAPSLTFGIYRKKYMPLHTIPITKEDIFDFLSLGFTGGSTEMYQPYGENLRCYDANSLYPSIMRDSLYGVGQIIQFKGDITQISKNKIWFAKVEVESKYDLEHPLLQLHYKTKEGVRTVAANGKFTTVISSTEYAAYKDYYNITIIEGYVFAESKLIFSEYIKELYDLRKQYPKDHPMNLTAKLLMNSLYGRFAMAPITRVQLFVHGKDLDKLCINNTVFNIIQIEDEDINMIDLQYPDFKGRSENSIGIAALTTANGRIFMSKFKNNPDFNLYYTDTDSIFIDKDLPDTMVGNELGQFKKEYDIDKAVFISPKCYSLIKTNGEYVNKIKGFKDAKNVPFSAMESLLEVNKTLELTHNKWFRNLGKGEISILEQAYLLKATDSKREFIYSNNKIVGTKALKIDTLESNNIPQLEDIQLNIKNSINSNNDAHDGKDDS